MTVRIAVVGLGIGKKHVETLGKTDGAELVGVCDVNEAVAGEVAAAAKTAPFSDYAAMLDAARPEAVILATPPKLHAAQTVLAAERGVHVLCEKPMAPSVGDCERMIAACGKAGVTLMIGFKKRFFPCYRLIRDKVRETQSPLLWATIRFALGRVDRDWFWDEADGGGPVVENSVHEFDILRFLMGEVREVRAVGGNFFMPHRAPQIDAAGVLLTFASGGIASLGIGYGCEWPLCREELLLASNAMVFELAGPFDNPDSLRCAPRATPKDVTKPITSRLDNPFLPELTHFLDCVRDGVPCEAAGEEGLAALRISLGVKQAIREKRTVQVS